MTDETQSYTMALAEVQEILRRIEDDSIDIDELVGEVQRATELILLCHDKIQRAEVSVKLLLDKLSEQLEPTTLD